MITSVCPFTDFAIVKEETSAPSSRGLWKYADSKVLSTTKNMSLCFLVISATARISTTFKVGLVGVSIQTILVLGRMAASILHGSVASTKLVSIFIRDATFLKYLFVPPSPTSSPQGTILCPWMTSMAGRIDTSGKLHLV